MTKFTNYRCNICTDYIQPTDDNCPPGFGMHYTGKGYEFKRVQDCERHICLNCAKSIHDELRKVTPASVAPDTGDIHHAHQA